MLATCTFFVYLDDILIVGTLRFVRKAVRRARQRLQRVGFLISGKFVTEPACNLDFVGKVFDFERHSGEPVGDAERLGPAVVAVGVGSVEQERNGEVAGSPGVGLKAVSGTEPIFSRCLLLETRGGQ